MLIDTHIHLDFYDDINKEIEEIVSNDIRAIFVTHMPELFTKYEPIIKSCANIRLALGFHPILIGEYELNKALFLENVSHTKYIGEVGLDYSITMSQDIRLKQRDAFEFICENVSNHILSVHSRLADKDALDILVKHNVKNVIFHWFTGSEKLMPQIIHQGYFFSVNQAMLRSSKGMGILKKIPRERLLIETDGPFVKYKGRIIAPDELRNVYKELSTFYNVTDISQIVYENFKTLLTNT